MRKSTRVERKPDWLKVRLNTNDNYKYIKGLVREGRLNTVCEEARCPNIHECWGEQRTATFMILGDICTRRCRFCSVKTGVPGAVDTGEPERLAASVGGMGLRHVVITMVNRDDLPDGGAAVLGETIEAVHRGAPECAVEVLASDLMAERDSIARVARAQPEVMSHNIETVRRLTPQIRSRSTYERSLEFLRIANELDPEGTTKSSMMLGLGESKNEILETMDDLRAVGVSIINLGQYLQPARTNIAVERYYDPKEFAQLKHAALEKGFSHCEAGPLVRSSYHAGEQYEHYRRRVHPFYSDE